MYFILLMPLDKSALETYLVKKFVITFYNIYNTIITGIQYLTFLS
jgi:hypothetical protein